MRYRFYCSLTFTKPKLLDLIFSLFYFFVCVCVCVFFFFFGGEEHKKGSKNTYLSLFLTEVGYRRQMEQTLGEQSDSTHM